MKLYLEGPATNATDAEAHMEATILNHFGTRVFSSAGEIQPLPVHESDISEEVQRLFDAIKARKAGPT
jgi:hypothetical protein